MAGPRKGAAWPVCAQLSGGGRPGPGSGPRVLLASAWQTAPPEGAVITPAWSRLGRPRPRAAHCLCLQLTPARRSRSSGRVTLLTELKSAAHGASLTPPVMGPPPRQSSVSPLPGPPRDGWPLRGRSCPGHWLHDRPVETGLLDAPLTRPSCPPGTGPSPVGWSSRGQLASLLTAILGATLPPAWAGLGTALALSAGTGGPSAPPRSPLSQGFAWGAQDRWPSRALAQHVRDTATGHSPPVGQRSGRCPGHSDLPGLPPRWCWGPTAVASARAHRPR